jgi:hypothetical protein
MKRQRPAAPSFHVGSRASEPGCLSLTAFRLLPGNLLDDNGEPHPRNPPAKAGSAHQRRPQVA